jgi:hypothetical protein
MAAESGTQRPLPIGCLIDFSNRLIRRRDALGNLSPPYGIGELSLKIADNAQAVLEAGEV